MASSGKPLYSLIYTSRAVSPFTQEEFDQLLERSRNSNGILKITGMLAHMGGSFMQVLEGSEEAVTGLFEKKIARDERHTMVEVVTRGGIAKREFGQWTMAFKNLDEKVGDRPEGFSDFVRQGFTSEIPSDHKGLSTAILRSFRKKYGAVDYPSPRG
jgi:hypothetical protein